MLIGLCGKAGSGKDTVADYLCEKYGFVKISLADPIKRLVKDVFVLDDKTVYDRVERERPLPEWNNWSVRKLLQYIGTELFRNNIDGAIWVKSLYRRVKLNPNINYVVSDCRFPNEIDYLKSNMADGFNSVKILRDGCDGSVGISGHESEKYDLVTDYVVFNDGAFDDLYERIDSLMENDIKFSKGE